MISSCRKLGGSHRAVMVGWADTVTLFFFSQNPSVRRNILNVNTQEFTHNSTCCGKSEREKSRKGVKITDKTNQRWGLTPNVTSEWVCCVSPYLSAGTWEGSKEETGVLKIRALIFKSCPTGVNLSKTKDRQMHIPNVPGLNIRALHWPW